MNSDSTLPPKIPGPQTRQHGSETAPHEPDLPPQEPAYEDIDPATPSAEEEDETLSLP